MKAYNAKEIRNIVVAGHGGRGKTSLCEAMLYLAKATDRLGKILDSNTVLDFDPEEKKRKTSIFSSMAYLEWRNAKINLLDTPGLFDFAGGVSEGMRAADCALIVTAAGSGLDVGVEKAYKSAEKRNLSKIFAISKCDAENADFYKTLDALKEEYGTAICPTVVPVMENDKVKCYVNFIRNKAYTYNNGVSSEVAMPTDAQIETMRDFFIESVASADDDLMEKYFEGQEFTDEEISHGLKAGIKTGQIAPVYACSGLLAEGVDFILNCLQHIVPSAAETSGEIAVDADGNEVELACDENGPLAAICFKTVADPFVGKMSFFKVISGKLTGDIGAYNTRTGQTERMGKIIFVRGSKQEETSCIPAGDIGVVAKLPDFKTGDTLSNAKKPLTLKSGSFPEPCFSRAVKVRKKGDEEKVASGLTKIMEEDKAITFIIDNETREQVISGLGDQHLDVIVNRLIKYGVEVDLTVPRVAYRETIRKKVEVQGRHKKQSGGHGQFGDVWIRFEPCDSDDLVFEIAVVGGSVPKNFYPAVEKGLRDSIQKGILAGYPVVGIKATLYDGSSHPVDSSEMAFKTAASIAYKNGMTLASPTILEPIGELKVYVPDAKMGDIMSDITKRRGRVNGMGPANEPKMQELVAEVPMAEMGDFATVLRSVTHGKGNFSIEFSRYEDAPANVAEKVIADSKVEE